MLGLLLAQDNEDQACAPGGVVTARLADGLDAVPRLGMRRWRRWAIVWSDRLSASEAQAATEGASGAGGEPQGMGERLGGLALLSALPEDATHGNRDGTGHHTFLRGERQRTRLLKRVRTQAAKPPVAFQAAQPAVG